MSYAATETVVDRPTSRQLEILDLMADGLPDKLIAARLGISVRCVRAHVMRLREQFACVSRPQLMARVVLLGLLRPNQSDAFHDDFV